MLNGMPISTAAPVPEVGNTVREEVERVWELEDRRERCEIQTSEYGVDSAPKLITWDAQEQAIHNQHGYGKSSPTSTPKWAIGGWWIPRKGESIFFLFVVTDR